MDIGHNGGPQIDDDDEPPGKLLFLGWAWRKARQDAFKAPTHEIALFRLARAEAAGMTYEAYVARLLDTGRHEQSRNKPAGGAQTVPRPTPRPMTNSGQTTQPLLQSRAHPLHAAQDHISKGRHPK